MSHSINSPLSRPPLELEPRAVSASVKARIIARDKHCRFPGCEVTAPLQVDHIVALALGGKNTDGNLEALCVEHHSRKTKADAKAIAKAKRRKLKNDGEFPKSPTPLKGRNSFPKRWEA